MRPSGALPTVYEFKDEASGVEPFGHDWLLQLPITGQEVFTPQRLLAGRLYRLTFRGVYHYRTSFLDKLFGTQTAEICGDALYRADEMGNIRKQHSGLWLDSSEARKLGQDWQEDRATHTYSCLVHGHGSRLSFRMYAQGDRTVAGEDTLSVRIELLPRGTLTSREQHELEERTRDAVRAAEKLRREQEQQQALVLRKQQEKEQAEALARKLAKTQLLERKRQLDRHVDELKRMVHVSRNIFDPAFRQAYIRKHHAEIRRASGKAWAAEYKMIMANGELVKRLQERAPEVLQWYEFRVDMAVEAERVEVLPAEPGLPAKPIPLTPRAMDTVREVIADVYNLRDCHDRLQRSGAQSDSHRLQQLADGGAAGLAQLRRYGIVADSPERAEQQLQELSLSRPVKTLYEQVRDALAAGNPAGLDILAGRVKDLFFDQCNLVRLRKGAGRRRAWSEQRELDERLARCRAEVSQLVDLLRERGFQLDLSHREHEETLSEGIQRLYLDKKTAQEFVLQFGDTVTAELIEVHFHEQLAQLFHSDATEDYT